ncbi:hypothetical protein BYT27DRAFT_7206409 [Phlegmacium glaucopus]|nr:hypothetical protein BYT27DRAFT_7206409 [Phlegmacium glaucopus]
MPPNRTTLTENLAKGRAIKAEKQAQVSSESALDDLWSSFQSAKLRITELELEVIQKSSECKQLQVELDKSNKKCSQLAADLSMWESKHKDTYHKLRMQRPTTKRGQDKVAQLTEQIAILKKAETNDSAHLLKDSKDAEKAIALLMEANEDLQGELSDSMTQWSSQLHKTRSKLEKSQSNCKALQKITALRKHSASIKAVKEHAIASVRAKLLKEKSVHHLMDKGVFTEETQNVVRLLVKAGCSCLARTACSVFQCGRLSWCKAERQALMLEKTVAELGKEAFEKLSDEEKRHLRLFIWAGCGCHKDLNTVRGGYLAIMGWWKENGLEGPVLLANRDNNPVVQERIAAIEQGDIPTSAQERAFNQSTHGAIKMAEIAGAIFNHKDDKKGHHDIFRYWWWEHVGTPFTFPDTSNNRFQSYCDAAGALILYSQQFIDFLHNLRINKTNSQLNHMEQNLMNALQCDSTKTELAVLAIYAEAISYPYMKAIRTSHDTDQNMLDLGPLHHHVYEHMQKIISNPDILLGNDVSCSSATLDGEEWQNPAVVKKIHELSPTLPHLRDLLLVFFKGAAETWECFTSEFAPGGLIDEATTEEKELAWMPATNDVNEGALGSFRHLMRYQPQLTLLNHNALAMRQAEKTARKEKREQKAKETADWIAATGIILDKVKALSLKGTLLKDQLKVFKNAGAPNLMTAKLPTKVADIRKALSDAIDLYEDGKWLLESDTEEGSDDSEEEDESGWEDDN